MEFFGRQKDSYELIKVAVSDNSGDGKRLLLFKKDDSNLNMKAVSVQSDGTLDITKVLLYDSEEDAEFDFQEFAEAANWEIVYIGESIGDLLDPVESHLKVVEN